MLNHLTEGQGILSFKMYTIKDQTSSGSSQLTKYYKAKLDQSKANGEFCIDNGECQTNNCLSTHVCAPIGIYFARAQRYASKFLFFFLSNCFVSQSNLLKKI